MNMHPSLTDLIVAFLVRNKLTEAYLKGLSPKRQCIGCTRDEGDHDGECPVDNPDMYDYKNGLLESKTSQKIKDQIKEILTRY